MKKFYEILDIAENSTQDEIKRAYRKLAKKYHPDLNPGDEAAQEKFKEINAAYEVLGDQERRAQYDRFGDEMFKNGNSASSNYGGGFSSGFGDIFGDIFDDIFGNSYYGRNQSTNKKNIRKKGTDIHHQITLTFEEAVFGTEQEITVQRSINCHVCSGSGAKPGTKKTVCDKCHGTGQVQRQSQSMFGTFIQTATCDKCHGTGEIIQEKCENCHGSGREKKSKKINIKIPAGVDTGMILTVRNEGNEGQNGGGNGDLFVSIVVKSHQFFQREGNDVFYEMPISFAQATLGAEIEVPTLDGVETFSIPAGTQTATRFTLKNKGIPFLRSKGRGNIYFDVKIIVPKDLTKKQKEILTEFAKTTEQSFKPKSGKKSIFDRIKDMFE